MKVGAFFVTFQIHVLYLEENRGGNRDGPQLAAYIFSEIHAPADKEVFASDYAGGLLPDRSLENVVGEPTV